MYIYIYICIYNIYVLSIQHAYIYIFTYTHNYTYVVYTNVFSLVPWHSPSRTAEVMKLPSEAMVLTVFLGPWRRIRLTNFRTLARLKSRDEKRSGAMRQVMACHGEWRFANILDSLFDSNKTSVIMISQVLTVSLPLGTT